MFIQTEATPNPATIKFMPGRTVLSAGTLNITNHDEAKQAPLAKRLMDIQGIAGVFFGSDFISVTKTEDQDWFALKPQILESMVHYFVTHETVEVISGSSQDGAEEHDEISKEIKELLDTRIRPAVAMDGGDIVFDRFENGVVYLHMQGSCSGCPSSSITLKSGIENMLRYYIPEVKEVQQINTID
ncbi:MAG: NifU family protein [Alphaproteobacteria bacterium]|nr:NifU family protein [Alphaproteobacteria bacterium]